MVKSESEKKRPKEPRDSAKPGLAIARCYTTYELCGTTSSVGAVKGYVLSIIAPPSDKVRGTGAKGHGYEG